MWHDTCLAAWLGLRFALTSRHKGFLTLVSWVSLLGMMLGVCALIVVLSVMNGFHQELRNRLLVLVPQWQIAAIDGQLPNAAAVSARLAKVLPSASTSPYIESTVLLSSQRSVRGARLLAILPGDEAGLQTHVPNLDVALQPGQYGVVLGRSLARQLDVIPGDRITVMLPQVSITPAGIFPRTRLFTVTDILSTGSQVDGEYAVIHLDDARRLFRTGQAVHGLRVNTLSDADSLALASMAPALAAEGLALESWRHLQGPLFDAVQMEKRMIALLLFVVIVVAAFNIVSMVAISVSRKRFAIAILRTLGAGRRVILGAFVMQGFVLGLAGIAFGALAGILLTLYLNPIIHALEKVSGLYLFDPAVFYIVNLPVLIQPFDIAWIVSGALVLALLSCMVPAWQASRLDPVAGLRP